jgi:hypothetical protein
MLFFLYKRKWKAISTQNQTISDCAKFSEREILQKIKKKSPKMYFTQRKTSSVKVFIKKTPLE